MMRKISVLLLAVMLLLAAMVIALLYFVVNQNRRIVVNESEGAPEIPSYRLVRSKLEIPFQLWKAGNFIKPENPDVRGVVENLLSNKPFFQNKERAIRNWIALNIKFRPEGDRSWIECVKRDLNPIDYWQYPEETIKLRSGDCEDFAFLLVNMLRAAGYSEKDVFVALGDEGNYVGHAFVAIRSENGKIRLIEPQSPTDPLGLLDWINQQNLGGMKILYLFNDVYMYKQDV